MKPRTEYVLRLMNKTAVTKRIRGPKAQGTHRGQPFVLGGVREALFTPQSSGAGDWLPRDYTP